MKIEQSLAQIAEVLIQEKEMMEKSREAEYEAAKQQTELTKMSLEILEKQDRLNKAYDAVIDMQRQLNCLYAEMGKKLAHLDEVEAVMKSLPDYAEFVKGYNCGGYHD